MVVRVEVMLTSCRTTGKKSALLKAVPPGPHILPGTDEAIIQIAPVSQRVNECVTFRLHSAGHMGGTGWLGAAAVFTPVLVTSAH